MAIIGTASLNAQGLEEGLIGYWPFDDQSDPASTPDLSSGENHGTINGEPEIVAGATGGGGDYAIQFDGADDSVTTEVSLLNDLDELTLSFWLLMPEQQPGNRAGLIGQNDAVEYGMINPTTMQYWTPAGNINVDFGPTLEEWTHVAVIVNADGMHVYSNGEQIGTAGGGGAVNSAFNFNMGGGGVYDAAGNWFLGSIDDVAVWNIALSEDQIAALAAQQIFPIARGGELVPGMIAYWPFDGDLNDAVGDSHGEGMGTDDIAYGSGKFGQGIDLDGADQYVETPVENEEMFDFQDGTGFSISAWFSVNEFTKSWQALIAKGEGNRWRVHRRGGENIMTGNGGNGDVPAGTPDINDGELHHIVLVSDPENDEVRLYSDGELASSNNGPQIQSNENPMMIGENPDARNRTWSGIIDDVGIWNRPLSEEEVVLLSENSIGNLLSNSLHEGMIAYWDFDDAGEILGGTVTDSVASIVGEVNGDTAAVEGTLGGAVEFGAGNWISVDASNGWLVPASDANKLTVSLWQKLNSRVSSSTFWFGASSANNGERNFQAHIPWGGGDIFFDTAGCCGGGDTRINKASDIDYLEWHHFVFVKDGDHKEIWVDGELFHEGENTGALFDDWTALGIGSNSTGGSNVDGIVDDFGVWARALTEDEIKYLAEGNQSIIKSWDFH